MRSPMSFEQHRTVQPTDRNQGIFPFVFHGRETFVESFAGSETKVNRPDNTTLLFADDYAVPAGLIIGVLFPEGYIPEIYKFKSMPYIPTGIGVTGASLSPPGHFDVFFNPAARLAAVTFMIIQPTYFGFKCIARFSENDFPSAKEYPFFSDLHATLGFPETHSVQITIEDLAAFRGFFTEQSDLQDLTRAINRLIKLVKSGKESSLSDVARLTQKLQNSLATTASVIQLSDSFLTGGTVSKLIGHLLMYLSF